MIKEYNLGIFDHSGVLSDDRRPVYETDKVILPRYGVTVPEFEEWFSSANVSAVESLRKRGVNPSKKEIDELYSQVYTEITTREENPIKPAMYGDAPEVLAALKHRGFKLAVVSSHPEERLIAELNSYGIAQYFDLISGNPSPKAKRLIDVCDELGVHGGKTFFVEDTVHGLRSGYFAGVDCFGITTGYHSRERLEAEGRAIKVVDSLTELLKFV